MERQADHIQVAKDGFNWTRLLHSLLDKIVVTPKWQPQRSQVLDWTWQNLDEGIGCFQHLKCMDFPSHIHLHKKTH